AAPAVKAKSIKIHVELAAALQGKVSPNDSVFVFARAINGPAAPLAVKRITVADLPAEVELSDADAMMPQLNLSNFAQVQLVARVSRAGQPTTGEWVGRSQPLASDTAAQQALIIDSPDN
ncbi:c-type cytochrome biogenesis protein CcmI/CycH, partial [Pseudomonas syringae pv. coryli]